MTGSDNSKGLVLAAVTFDERSAAVVRAASSLAKRFGMEVRFVHVIDMFHEFSVTDFTVSMYGYPAELPRPVAELKDEAQRGMNLLLETVPDGVRKSGVVLTGAAAQALAAEAEAQQANLIVTGCDPESYTTLSQGFSTTLELMHIARLPVLAVSAKASFDANKIGLRLLLADDLLPATEAAAQKAYELAARVEGAHVRHVHVHQPARFLAPKSNLPAEEAWARTLETRQETMRGRGMPYRSVAADHGAKIEIDLRDGQVGPELQRAISDYAPDLVIFGRHRLLHVRPHLIGRMPFRAMLQAQRPVLLVPPTSDLYERRPFPSA